MGQDEFRQLQQKRRNWVEANRENNFEQGINHLLIALYPDKAHFIYELLQNAEDAQATEIAFCLTSEKLSTCFKSPPPRLSVQVGQASDLSWQCE